MRVPLPFLECPKCHEKSTNSIHRNCGGNMLIEVLNEDVFCERCRHSWNIWNSDYYCNCGHVFSAGEVEHTVQELIESCKMCALVWEMEWKEREKRPDIAKTSFRTFVTALLEGAGKQCGVAVGSIISAVLRFFGV